MSTSRRPHRCGRETAPGWEALRAIAVATVRFSAERPVLSQLLFARPVPGFEPSASAYAPSVAALELVRDALHTAVQRSELVS